MPLSIQDLSTLAQTDYDAARQLVLDWVNETYPGADLPGGPLDSLVLQPSAVLEAANQKNIDRVRLASSLQAIDADATLADAADEAVIDRLLSNYRITRLAAAAATGQVTLLFSVLTPVVVPSGTVFTDAAGHNFTANSAYTGRVASGDVVSTSDRLLVAVGDGTYSMTIDVTASATGPASNIARATVVTTTATIPNLTKALAAADFTGGRTQESNTAMVARMRSSWAGRTAATRTGIDGLFRLQTGFEGIIGTSVVGYGDAEQRRNHSVLPLSMPGRVDVYVRTQGPWQSVQKTKTALLVGTAMSGTRGVWQITLTRDDAPIYTVDKVVLPKDQYNAAAAGYAISSTTRGYDITAGAAGSAAGLVFLPDITSATEAAFSRYQTIVLTLVDVDSSIAGLTVGVSTAPYVVFYKSMPGIATLQDAIAARSVRSTMGDCLVKAPVPCFVAIAVNVAHNLGATAVTTTTVKDAVAAAVNALGFVGTLPFSTIISAAQGVLPAGSTVSSVTASGTIYRPDGTTTAVSGSTGLTPTTDNAGMISPRTICFYTSATDVTVVVSDVSSPES